ncbi:hypothetical protein ABK040_002942 [Willaertia magna]
MLKQFEEWLICHDEEALQEAFDNEENAELKELLKFGISIVKGRFLEGLKQLKKDFPIICNDFSEEGLNKFYLNLESEISTFLNSNKYSSEEIKHGFILFYGVLFIQIFVQQNFVGPSLDKGIFTSLPFTENLSQNNEKPLQKFAVDKLSIDGEIVFQKTEYPHYLICSEHFLKQATLLDSSKWWKLRLHITHQRLLTYCAETLLNEITKCFEYLDPIIKEYDNGNDELIGRYYVEKGLVDFHFMRQQFALEAFEKAKEATGLYLNLTGKWGVGTKYQSYKTAQLVLEAKSRAIEKTVKEENEEVMIGSLLLPETAVLEEDSHLLEKPKYDIEEEEEDLVHCQIRPIDQCIILALCLDIKNTNPDYGLTKDNMMPYIFRVLEQPQNWLIQSEALLLRARIECGKHAFLLRSLEQYEKLVGQYKQLDPNLNIRLKYFYSAAYPPIFELERELAQIHSRVGSYESALLIYKKYDMVEDTIKTFVSLDQENRAKKVAIDNLLSDPNDPLLWCILADLMRTEKLRQEYHVEGEEEIFKQCATALEMYEKSWEVSKHRFARAKRSIGYFYTEAKEYEKALEPFEESLALSSLHKKTWFVYGFCCMQCKEWKKALNAYSRSTFLEAYDAEAWSNLANVHVNLGNKQSAVLALKEASRIAYNNSRIWQNYLYVCIDANDFDNAMSAVKRLVDIKQDKILDTDVLDMFLRVFRILSEKSPPHAEHMREELYDMFEKIVSKISLDPFVWKAYSGYHEIIAEFAKDEEEKIKHLQLAVEKRQKLVRSLQLSGWEKEKSKFELVCFSVQELVKLQQRVAELSPKEEVKVQYLSMAEDILKSVTKRTEQVFKETEDYKTLSELLTKVQQQLQ